MTKERASANDDARQVKPITTDCPYHHAIYTQDLVKAAAQLYGDQLDAGLVDDTAGIFGLLSVIQDRLEVLSQELSRPEFSDDWHAFKKTLGREAEA